MSNESTENTEHSESTALDPIQDPGSSGSQDVTDARDFVRENGMSVLIGVGLAVAVFLGFSAYKNYKASAALTASDLLFKAQSTEQIQNIINQYPSTPAAPLAYLSLATSQFDGGQYELADHVYAEFQQKFPDHMLVEQAELGRAHCKEAAGQLNEAMDAFVRFATAHPDHYLQPLAVLGQARCLEQMSKFPEAKAVYEDFIAASGTNNQWTARAEAALLYLDKDARAAKNPQPVTAVAPQLAPINLNPAPTAPIASP